MRVMLQQSRSMENSACHVGACAGAACPNSKRFSFGRYRQSFRKFEMNNAAASVDAALLCGVLSRDASCTFAQRNVLFQVPSIHKAQGDNIHGYDN